MGSTVDKAKGSANENIGKAKQAIGKAIGSGQMKNEGRAQELKGDAQQTLGKAKDVLKGVANRVADEADRKL